MRRGTRPFRGAGVLVAAAVLLGGCTQVVAAVPHPAAGTPAAAPAGASVLSPAALQSRWWSWAESIPEAANPVEDPDGSFCAMGQPDDVWFLAGTTGGTARRACAVPAGRPLAFPVINLVVSDPADCVEFMGTAKGSATVDGAPVAIDRYDAQDEFVVTAVAGSPFSDATGEFKAFGCGLWVQAAGLAPGRHTVDIAGGSRSFSLAVHYDLTVEPASSAST